MTITQNKNNSILLKLKLITQLTLGRRRLYSLSADSCLCERRRTAQRVCMLSRSRSLDQISNSAATLDARWLSPSQLAGTASRLASSFLGLFIDSTISVGGRAVFMRLAALVQFHRQCNWSIPPDCIVCDCLLSARAEPSCRRISLEVQLTE